jgi:predicted unusual protein kinase regulating ubiquinone biosynthesis (AarF/ABC1/UbiB family)
MQGAMNDKLKRPPEEAPLGALREGFRKRTLATVKTMARVGWRVAKRNFSSAEALEAVDDDAMVAWAETVRAELDELKGLALKVGQMMSYLDVSIPPKARGVLARLQYDSRPMTFEAVAGVVRTALGDEPAHLFDEFDPVPFAAASLGQVHRASVDGHQLAVKVQYPEIRRLLAGDLQTVGKLARLATFLGPLDGKALITELASRVLEECDYAREAAYQERFRVAFQDHPGIDVPRVLARFSSGGVLTSELVQRMGFRDFLARADQDAKDRAGERIYEAAIRSIFHHGVYNADPHPGNYLFAEDGCVTLLDFGCVKVYSEEFIAIWKRLARSILDGDRDAFRSAFSDAGFVARRRRFDFDHMLAALQVLYEPMRAKKPFTFTTSFLERVHDALLFKNRNKFRMTMPPDWLWANRLQLGMFSVLAELGATAPWPERFREALALPWTPLDALPANDAERHPAELAVPGHPAPLAN